MYSLFYLENNQLTTELKSMPCNIIFDIDGTLADTKAVDDKCFIQAFMETFQIDLQHQNWAALENVTDWGITEEVIQTNLNRTPTAIGKGPQTISASPRSY
jgi:beta-phosphoglucomutase-like phosphatase (HAD superfamily)